MGTKRYPPSVIAKCKSLMVYEGWSCEKVSEFYDGKPSAGTVSNWASEIDPETEKNWYDERDDFIDQQMNQVSPQMIEAKYMQRIWEVLNKPEFSTADSDSLRKLQKDFREMTDPNRQIPVLYGFLEELIDYLNKYHGEIVNKEFLEAIREYKNHQRSKLTS